MATSHLHIANLTYNKIIEPYWKIFDNYSCLISLSHLTISLGDPLPNVCILS